jgi:hypothetical protein
MPIKALQISANCNMPDHVDVMLANNKSTGALLLRNPGGQCKLQVRRGQRGRGLFAALPVNPGEILATIAGHVVSSVVNGCESWHLAKNKFFVMEPCSRQHLGILANTAARACRNNARYVVLRTNTTVMQLRAARRIAAGDEILAAYGNGYAAAVTKRAEEERMLAAATAPDLELIAPIRWRPGAAKVMICAKCDRRVTPSIRIKHARMCTGTLHLY